MEKGREIERDMRRTVEGENCREGERGERERG